MRLRSILPFNPYRYEDMMQELEHAFNKRPFSDWGMGTVKVDVFEDKTGVTVKADLPGINEDDIDVTLFDSTLTIRGEKKAEKENKGENFYMMERSFGSFSRSINLPYKADINKIEADYTQGVLTITIPRPKTPEGQLKKIKVKSQSATQKKSSKK